MGIVGVTDTRMIFLGGRSQMIALVSVEDADLADIRWHESGAKERPYPATRAGAYLHRLIGERMAGRKLGRHEEIDHKNGDTFDARRSNLRLATRAQNTANSGARINNKSGLKGVSHAPYNKSKPWRAAIVVDGKNIHLGYHTTPELAAAAYDAVCRQYQGEFARPNSEEA